MLQPKILAMFVMQLSVSSALLLRSAFKAKQTPSVELPSQQKHQKPGTGCDAPTQTRCYELQFQGCSWDERPLRKPDNPFEKYMRNGSGLVHDLEHVLPVNDSTPPTCAALCFLTGYSHMGLQFGKECLCGMGFNREMLTETSKCDMKCIANNSFVCGGFDVTSVYTIHEKSCAERKKKNKHLFVEASLDIVNPVLRNWQSQWLKWDEQPIEVDEEAAALEANMLKEFKSLVVAGDHISKHLDGYLYHFDQRAPKDLVVLDLVSSKAPKLFEKCKVYAEGTIASNTAPIDMIIVGGKWRAALVHWFPKLRPGGWFAVEGFDPSSTDALELLRTVQVMHRMYLAKGHTNFTVLGTAVDHEFKSMFFWKGSVFIQKGESMPRWDSAKQAYDTAKFPSHAYMGRWGDHMKVSEPSFNDDKKRLDWPAFVEGNPKSAFNNPHNKDLLSNILGTYHVGYDDKVCIHSYDLAYGYLLRRLSTKHTKMLEIGVSEGNSVELWRRVFPDVEYHGVDIVFQGKVVPRIQRLKQRRALPSQSFDIHIADQSVAMPLHDLMRRLRMDARNESSKFDLIIDDGSHASDMHIVSFNALWPFLKRGGVYVVEDMGATAFAPAKPPFKWSERRDQSMTKAIGTVQTLHTEGNSTLFGNFDPQFNKQFKMVAFFDQMMVFQKKDDA